MPEMPEVAAVAAELDAKMRGKTIAAGHLVAFSALKTFRIGLDALAGLEVSSVTRHGKFLDVDAQGIHLIFHLMRAGWVTWHDVAPKVPARPGKSGLVLRIVLDDDSGFSLTEAGTQRALAVYVVEDPQEVPGIAALGPDPLAPGVLRDGLDGPDLLVAPLPGDDDAALAVEDVLEHLGPKDAHGLA